RVGIATGEALVGSIGSEFMMNYTVMGDTVNLASRLEAANKVYGTHILATEATVIAAQSAIEVREIDRAVVAGQSQPQVVYEIMGRKNKADSKSDLLKARYAEGLAAYRARRWDEASAAFSGALEIATGDGPSKALSERVNILRNGSLPAVWDGA